MTVLIAAVTVVLVIIAAFVRVLRMPSDPAAESWFCRKCHQPNADEATVCSVCAAVRDDNE